MSDYKPVSTPMENEATFVKLIYASIGNRPNISYAVEVLSQLMSNPGEEHWREVKRILSYIKGTLSHCFEFVFKNVS